MKIWFISGYSGHLLRPNDFISGKEECYGSEFALLEIAKRLQATVFSSTPKGYSNDYLGIDWRSDQDYEEMVKISPPDVMIVSRFAAWFIEHTIPNCKCYLWLHDLVPHMISKHGMLSKNVMGVIIPQIEKFVCVGYEMIPNLHHYGIHPSQCVVIKNGITVDPLWSKELLRSKKIKNTFIYSSWAEKGLWNLLDHWNLVLGVIPDARLEVYYNHSLEEIERRKKYSYNSVTYHGRVTQDVLFEAMKKSEYWLFPNEFPETCCTTSFEMGYYGCIQITNSRGELKHNVRGNLIDIDEANDAFWRIVVDVLKTIKDDDHLKKLIVDRQYKFAVNQTWDKRKEEWLSLIK